MQGDDEDVQQMTMRLSLGSNSAYHTSDAGDPLNAGGRDEDIQPLFPAQ